MAFSVKLNVSNDYISSMNSIFKIVFENNGKNKGIWLSPKGIPPTKITKHKVSKDLTCLFHLSKEEILRNRISKNNIKYWFIETDQENTKIFSWEIFFRFYDSQEEKNQTLECEYGFNNGVSNQTDKNLCTSYYQISILRMIKSYYHPKLCSEIVSVDDLRLSFISKADPITVHESEYNNDILYLIWHRKQDPWSSQRFTMMLIEKENVLGVGEFIPSLKPKSAKKMYISLYEDSNYVGQQTLFFESVFSYEGKHKKDYITDNGRQRSVCSKKPCYIGHRGSGGNYSGGSVIQENSLYSFRALESFKELNYIEFDVQATKDLKMVIHHDFDVNIEENISNNKSDGEKNENIVLSKISIPVCQLNLTDFLKIGKMNHRSKLESDRGVQLANFRSLGIQRSKTVVYATKETKKIENQGKIPSLTLSPSNNIEIANNLGQNIKNKDPNIIGTFAGGGVSALVDGTFITQSPLPFSSNAVIHEDFVTLGMMFKKISPRLNFNIEVKYPYSPKEIKELGYPNRNIYVDSVLSSIYKYHKGPRQIFFSSFDIMCCIILHYKQPFYPVYLLVDLVKSKKETHNKYMISEKVFDYYIVLASNIGLRGIVSNCDNILNNPDVVKQCHNSGLEIMTYGIGNVDPILRKIQIDNGIDGIILDNVTKNYPTMQEFQKVVKQDSEK